MSKNKETLEKLLEKGTHNECISFLSSLTEKERRELAPMVFSYYRKYNKWELVEKDGNPIAFQFNSTDEQRLNSCLSALMTGSITELKKHQWTPPHEDENIIEVMRSCPRLCYEDLPLLLLEQSLFNWSLVRQLVMVTPSTMYMRSFVT